MTLLVLPTADLDPKCLAAARPLMTRAFGARFTDDDWDHALGGHHALRFDAGVLVAHAAVVPRTLQVGDQPLRTGYVEAVAVDPDRQRTGLGTEVMRALEPTLRTYQLCALSTGTHRFYTRLGWERWRGTTWVRVDGGRTRTVDEDDGILVWRTPLTGALDLGAELTCEPRPGDDW